MLSRKKWVTSRKAFDTSARPLHKMYPEMTTYKAQVQVLDENKQLRARLAQFEEAIKIAIKRADNYGDFHISQPIRAVMDGK